VRLTAHANADAERFVRSIEEECLDRVIVLGKHHLRLRSESSWRTIMRNGTIKASAPNWVSRRRDRDRSGPVRRPQRMGGMLNYYRAEQ
jgi:hypothetical protein